jgi:ribosomal protein S18 acetylase RimI-like enzyme
LKAKQYSTYIYRMLEFKNVKYDPEINEVANLAKTILHEFYHPQMPKEHIDFFISEFQTAAKIKKQIQDNFEYYLISDKNINIGYLGLEIKSDYLVLSKLYLLDSARGSNIGAKAIQLTKQRLKDGALSKIELFVNHLNQGGIKFYEKHGFKNIRSTVHKFASGQSEIDILMRFTTD